MMKKQGYEIIPQGEPISKSGVELLLDDIRPVWKDKNLIQRVKRLLPVDPSSACQRLFNASIHDLKEKILILGVDLANDTAKNYKLPLVDREEDILNYNVSKTIDLAYRIGVLTRPEWRRIHRCYEIRRDLEHEDDEYEAVLEDCFYIFKTTVGVVLSKDPIELLRVTDAKDLVESSTNITITEEFLVDYTSAPKGRQKEISELLISFAYDDSKPDIVRENSIELLRHLKKHTNKTVKIELASVLESKLNRTGINLKTAKIAHACGVLGYFKKVRINDFYTRLRIQLNAVQNWAGETKFCQLLEDIGGLKYCPDYHYQYILKQLVIFYVGEKSYGYYKSSRSVFFSNGAAPIIERIIDQEGRKASTYIESFRNSKPFSWNLKYVHLLRRFEYLMDIANKEGEDIA